MIRIFNTREERAILIDEKVAMVSFQPRHWDEENPHMLIELKGFHFSHHALTCSDCGAFQRAFGTESTDWHIEYNGKSMRLDLSNFGEAKGKNQIVFRISEFESGTKMKLILDMDTIEQLKALLELVEVIEDYPRCCIIRDKINAISG